MENDRESAKPIERLRIKQKTCGFTLVELVIVLILIGTLSVLGIGLFAGRSAFSPILASQQASSAALLAQQAGLAGNGANTLEINQTTDKFTFTVGANLPTGDSRRRTFAIDRESASLSVPSGLPLTLNFNSSGGLSSGSNFLLTFSGDVSFATCISSRGAVYQGSCQP